MFVCALAFGFLPLPPVGEPVFVRPVPKISSPPAIVGFALDPVGDRVGRVLDVDALPLPLDEVLQHFAGVRAGPDGEPWLAGGPLTVMLDGVSLGGAGSMFSQRRAIPRTAPVGPVLPRLP